MAIFSNQVETNSRPEQSSKPQPTLAPGLSVPAPASERAAKHTEPGASPAYLDRGTKISGKLQFEGPARIDGQVDGEIDGTAITIGESAVVTAQIRAESVVVCGKVKGEITASQRIEIRPTAKVTGNVTAPRLVVQEGAIFEGHCAMGSEPGHEERKAAHRNGAAESRLQT